MNIQDALSLAIQNYDNKQFIVAESYLNDILKSESENIQALHLLAIIHAIRSNEKECIRLFDKVLEIIPDSVPILKDYAKALTDLKLNERAFLMRE
jgi:predicted Zn-dependent protease